MFRFPASYFVTVTSPLLLFYTTCSSVLCHATEETYTAIQLNLAKLTKEPSATYQIRLWSQRGTTVNRPHHGDILLRSPPWFGNIYKFNLTRKTPSAVHTQPEEHNERTEHTEVYSSSWATLQQRSSSKMVVLRYHCSKSLGDRTFEMPSTWRLSTMRPSTTSAW